MRTKRQKLRGQCDRLWYEKYLSPECEACGCASSQVHHFYYKGSFSHLRYDKDNGISLCNPCHFLLHHQDPKRIEEKVIEKRGKRWYNKLQKKSRQKPPPSYLTIKYYSDIIKELS